MIRKIIRIGELVTVDNFSTYRNGNPIGDRRFIWVDTVSKQWGFADDNSTIFSAKICLLLSLWSVDYIEIARLYIYNNIEIKTSNIDKLGYRL